MRRSPRRPTATRSTASCAVGERWLPVKEIPNNLPQQGTSFIGREREIDEVKALLGATRLVTLLGMGGLGKTRLSLQVAAEQMARFPDGVWFLDLAPLRDAALVVGEAARCSACARSPDRPLLQTLCAHLKPRRVLLDPRQLRAPDQAVGRPGPRHRSRPRRTCACSRPAARRCTCRASRPTRSCRCRCRRRGDSLEALSRSTAVRLFVERAQAHKPAFALNEREAPAVAELVARLEGIPLALELAAARVRSLSVADINARLKDRYKILTGGSRVLQERQQTLRALVDWSLRAAERERADCCCAGWRCSSAASTWRRPSRCAAPSRSTTSTCWTCCGSLVEKSLVMLDERDDGVALPHAGDDPRLRAREAEQERRDAQRPRRGTASTTSQMAKDANARLGGRRAGRLDPARRDRARQRARRDGAGAGRRRRPGHRGQVRGRDAGLLDPARLCDRGPRRGARRRWRCRRSQASDLAQAHALYVGAALAESQSDHAEARQMLETCLALRRGLGNPVDIAATLSTLSLARLQAGDAHGAARRRARGAGDLPRARRPRRRGHRAAAPGPDCA